MHGAFGRRATHRAVRVGLGMSAATLWLLLLAATNFNPAVVALGLLLALALVR